MKEEALRYRVGGRSVETLQRIIVVWGREGE